MLHFSLREPNRIGRLQYTSTWTPQASPVELSPGPFLLFYSGWIDWPFCNVRDPPLLILLPSRLGRPFYRVHNWPFSNSPRWTWSPQPCSHFGTHHSKRLEYSASHWLCPNCVVMGASSFPGNYFPRSRKISGYRNVPEKTRGPFITASSPFSASQTPETVQSWRQLGHHTKSLPKSSSLEIDNP